MEGPTELTKRDLLNEEEEGEEKDVEIYVEVIFITTCKFTETGGI
jgi:hypothetical protein